MNARKLQCFLLTLVASSPLACSSTSSCEGNNPTSRVYALALLEDAGTLEAGVDAGAGTCEEACARLAGTALGYSTLVGCGFTTIDERGQKVPAVECRVQSICEGRRPEGFCPEDGEASVGGTAGGDPRHEFAVASQLEAASVFAFARLARELRHHRAPRRLISAARRARRDEIRHTRATAALARRQGARVPRVNVERLEVRELEAIAIENAVEGCIRETYGAATAWHRALHASDPVVRATYRRIARDETRHAVLAHELDGWLRARLSQAARGRVEEARAAAVVELRDAVGADRVGWVDALSGWNTTK